MIFGITLTILGIFGVVVFLYFAYKAAIKPIDNEKDKVMKSLDSKSGIVSNIKVDDKFSYLSDVPDETSYLFEEDEYDDEETDFLYEDNEIDEDETALLEDETELL